VGGYYIAVRTKQLGKMLKRIKVGEAIDQFLRYNLLRQQIGFETLHIHPGNRT